MNEDIQKMLRMAELIRDATQVGENTAVRVGTEIYDIVVELSRMLAMMDMRVAHQPMTSKAINIRPSFMSGRLSENATDMMVASTTVR